MTFLQVDRCSNEPFSTYCVFYRSSFWNIACIAYFTNSLRIILRMLHVLRCIFYNEPFHGDLPTHSETQNFSLKQKISKRERRTIETLMNNFFRQVKSILPFE